MNSKPVAKYSLDGKLLKIYESVKKAQQDFNILPAISSAARGIVKTAGGYQWKYFKQTPLLEIDKCMSEKQSRGISKRKQVAQYNLDGKLIKVYESQLEATKETGVSNFDISNVVRNKRSKTAGGFQWRFWNKDKPIHCLNSIENKYIRMVKKNTRGIICWYDDLHKNQAYTFNSANSAAKFIKSYSTAIKKASSLGILYKGLYWGFNE